MPPASPSGRTRLRQALRSGPIVRAPGVYDGLSAQVAAQRGLPALYLSGAATSVAHGYPDYGLLSMTEMVAAAARVTACVDVPLVADADTGYGGELNVVRTIAEYTRAGVAALHIEDQVAPKRSGGPPGKEVVPKAEWLGKIRAALESRPDPELVVIARTDARSVADLDEALERVAAAFEIGADLGFVEGLTTEDEVARVPREAGGLCLYNAVWREEGPAPSPAELEGLGYRMVIFPTALMEAAASAYDATLDDLVGADGPPARSVGDGPGALARRVGSERWDALRARFAPPRT